MNVDPRSGLTGQQVELLRNKLLAARGEVLDRARRRRPPSTLGSIDSEAAGDPIDQAEGSFEQGLQGSLSTSDQQRLKEIDEALARIDGGHYGMDEVLGEPIGFDRLWAAPWARFTQDHQEQIEAAGPSRRPPSL